MDVYIALLVGLVIGFLIAIPVLRNNPKLVTSGIADLKDGQNAVHDAVTAAAKDVKDTVAAVETRLTDLIHANHATAVQLATTPAPAPAPAAAPAP